MSLADKILNAIMPWTMLFLIGFVALIFGALIYAFFNPQNKCAIYSEEKEKHGFIMVGKIATPTTYKSRDCLVYEGGTK